MVVLTYAIPRLGFKGTEYRKRVSLADLLLNFLVVVVLSRLGFLDRHPSFMGSKPLLKLLHFWTLQVPGQIFIVEAGVMVVKGLDAGGLRASVGHGGEIGSEDVVGNPADVDVGERRREFRIEPADVEEYHEAEGKLGPQRTLFLLQDSEKQSLVVAMSVIGLFTQGFAWAEHVPVVCIALGVSTEMCPGVAAIISIVNFLNFSNFAFYHRLSLTGFDGSFLGLVPFFYYYRFSFVCPDLDICIIISGPGGRLVGRL